MPVPGLTASTHYLGRIGLNNSIVALYGPPLLVQTPSRTGPNPTHQLTGSISARAPMHTTLGSWSLAIYLFLQLV